MKRTSIMTATLLIGTVLVLSGCDQAEKSAQQLMGKAAETAKQAIDDTHKAAEQALSDATKELSINTPKPADKAEKPAQEI